MNQCLAPSKRQCGVSNSSEPEQPHCLLQQPLLAAELFQAEHLPWNYGVRELDQKRAGNRSGILTNAKS